MDPLTITIGDLVAKSPASARILERHRIDYCCGGNRSLAAACAQAGVDVRMVLAEIAGDETHAHDGETWADRPLAEVVGFIVDHHHARLRAELPRLRAMVGKVASVHGQHRSEFSELARVFHRFADEIGRHMDSEERILFPWILAGAREQCAEPIASMRHEHDTHGAALERMRALCDGYEAPDHACSTWRGLYAALARLESELMEHIHLENHVVFPRTLGHADAAAG